MEGRVWKLLASDAHALDMCILYMKDTEKPDEEVDEATPTTRYVVGYGKLNYRAEYGADDFEDGLLESMMGQHLWYRQLQKRVDDGRRSSERKRNPLLLRWMTSFPPSAHAQIADALERLTCSLKERKMNANYMNASFVDLTKLSMWRKRSNVGKPTCVGNKIE
jgi:hypothetical protein